MGTKNHLIYSSSLRYANPDKLLLGKRGKKSNYNYKKVRY